MARTVRIGKKPAMIVHHRLDEIRELPAPGVSWRWSRVETSQGTLQILRDSGLITDVDDGRWRTSGRLAEFLEERHGIELRRQTRLTVF